MTYDGYQELKLFVEEQKRPKFNVFASTNKSNLVRWSMKLSANSHHALHGIWVERYRQVLRNVKATDKGAQLHKGNVSVWNEIMNNVMRRRKLLETFKEQAIEVLTIASTSAATEAIQLLNADNNNNVDSNANDGDDNADDNHNNADNDDDSNVNDGDSDTNDGDDNNANDDDLGAESDLDQGSEHVLYPYAVKKKVNGKLEPIDKQNIQAHLTQGNTMLGLMNNHVIRLICKDKVTVTEEETIKLLLSSVINLLDRSIYQTMANIFSSQQLKLLGTHSLFDSDKVYGLDLPSVALLDEIIDNCKDLDAFLHRIMTER
ncbi:unnamed protein product [Absidia cylindrospora]